MKDGIIGCEITYQTVNKSIENSIKTGIILDKVIISNLEKVQVHVYLVKSNNKIDIVDINNVLDIKI